MQWVDAPDIKKDLKEIKLELKMNYIDLSRIICFRSYGSSSRARARIWSLPRIWQQALKVKPHYCLEVISERFDRLHPQQQEEILIHELRHIPKNFSGSLLPHGRMRKR